MVPAVIVLRSLFVIILIVFIGWLGKKSKELFGLLLKRHISIMIRVEYSKEEQEENE